MAITEHLEILKQGVGVWNAWRSQHPGLAPDLSGEMLSGKRFEGIDLSGADLKTTWLDGGNLINANLSDADLSFAILSSASLIGADFSRSRLYKTDLSMAYLSNAKFTGSTLLLANLNGSELTGADFSGAQFRGVVFGGSDLSAVNGLESAHHLGPSAVDIKTIYHSQGGIPEEFLRGCGVPADFIKYYRALTIQPIQFYSCFISYSSKDQEFADRLHADLQDKGVRCWFAPHDLKIGDRFRDRIDESIRLHDKLLLILSENSVSSPWVSVEVEAAMEREHREGRIVLFPIKIDEVVTGSDQAWAASIRRTRHIGDFTRWKSHDNYQKAFDRLLRDLKTEA